MGQAAYDYNAVRRRKAPQTQRKADLRVAKGGKRRLSPLQAAVHNAMHLVAAALLVGFAISLLWSESKLVELNDQIQDAKAQLVSEQSQYTYYNSTLNSKTNITSVEETAGRLGLMKIDQSQITYIRLGESDTLERTPKESSRVYAAEIAARCGHRLARRQVSVSGRCVVRKPTPTSRSLGASLGPFRGPRHPRGRRGQGGGWSGDSPPHARR